MKRQITVIRENLEDREVVNYRPLESFFDVRVVSGTLAGPYSASGVGLPVERLKTTLDRVPTRLGRALVRRSGVGRQDVDELLGLSKALARTDIAVVNEMHMASSAQACRVAGKMTGLRVVTVCYENIPFRYDDHPRLAARREAVRAGTDLFIALTPQVRDALIEEEVAPDRIEVIPYGVDPARFRASRSAAVRSEWGASDNDVVLLFSGRFIREKGLVELIRAVGSLGDEKCVLVLVGSGPEEQRLRRAASATGLRRVVIVPWVDPAQMPVLLASADVFVMPSLPTPYWQEQLGFSAIEAMAAGLPVVTVGSSSLPFVVGDGAMVARPYDIVDLARQVQLLIDDDSLRRRLGAAGRRRVEEVLNTKCFARDFEKALRAHGLVGDGPVE